MLRLGRLFYYGNRQPIQSDLQMMLLVRGQVFARSERESALHRHLHLVVVAVEEEEDRRVDLRHCHRPQGRRLRGDRLRGPLLQYNMVVAVAVVVLYQWQLLRELLNSLMDRCRQLCLQCNMHLRQGHSQKAECL